MNNVFQLFYRGADDALYTRAPIYLGGWDAEQPLGGGLGGDPIAVQVPSTDDIQVFYAGTDDSGRLGTGSGLRRPGYTLRSCWSGSDESPTGWSNEQNLGGTIIGNPIAAQVPGTDNLQVFYPGENNGLYSRVRSPDGTWSGEQNLGATLNGAPFVVQLPGTDILQVFFRSSDNFLWSLWRSGGNGSWTPSEWLGGTQPTVFGDPVAIQVPGTNNLQIFYRGPDNTVRSRLWNSGDSPGNLSPEQTLGGGPR